MIAIGNGEPCPFCSKEQIEAQQKEGKVKYKDIFINKPELNFVEHLFKEHPKEAEKALFGGKDVGI